MNFQDKLKTLGDIKASTIQGKDVEFIGKDFIPMAKDSYNLLTGQGGSGKSYIALQMIVREARKGKRCLAWSTEDGAGTTKHRLEIICDKILKTTEAQKNFIMSKIDILDLNFVHRFVKKINGSAVLESGDLIGFSQMLLKYDIAILDPLKAFHSADENENSHMDVLVRDLFQTTAEKTKCTLLVIHHTPKGASEDRISSRGASTIADSARLGLEVIPYMKKREINGRDMYVKDKDKETILQVYPRKDNHNAARFFTKGFDFIAFPPREPAVEVIEYQEEKDEKVIVSISKDITKDFKAQRVDFKKLKDLVKSDYNYSMSLFKDGYRNKENYVSGGNVIALDIDDGLSLKEAKILFEPYKHIIATTKSHQKDKNGKVCDRFRVLLKTQEITLNAEDFAEMMKEIYREFPFVDKQCSDPSRFYFPAKNSKVYSTDGFMEFEWQTYHNRAKSRKNIEKEKRLSATTQPQYTENGTQVDWYRKYWKTDKMLEKLKHSEKFIEGQRNHTLYSWGLFFKEIGLSEHEVQDAIYWLNAVGDGIPEKEINNTVLRSLGVAI